MGSAWRYFWRDSILPGSEGVMLAYIFWHRPYGVHSQSLYESTLLEFHQQLVQASPPGFKASAAYRISPTPWLVGSPSLDPDLPPGRQGRLVERVCMADALGGLDEAIEEAARLAGLPERPRLILPRRRGSFGGL